LNSKIVALKFYYFITSVAIQGFSKDFLI